MSRRSRQRGNQAELMAANWLTYWTGEEFHRTPRSGGLRWQKDKRIRGDIVPPEGFDFPFTVEVKMRTPKVNKKSGKVFERYNIGDILVKGRDSLILQHWEQQCVPDADAVEKRPLLFLRNAAMPKHMFWVIMEYEIGYLLEERGPEEVDVMLSKYWDITITTTEELAYIKYETLIELISGE